MRGESIFKKKCDGFFQVKKKEVWRDIPRFKYLFTEMKKTCDCFDSTREHGRIHNCGKGSVISVEERGHTAKDTHTNVSYTHTQQRNRKGKSNEKILTITSIDLRVP